MLFTRNLVAYRQFILANLIVCFLVGMTEISLAQSAKEKRVEQHLIDFEQSSFHDQDEAAARLLMTDPKSVSKSLRNRVAKAFRKQALESRHGAEREVIQGLVHWGGKYSTPVLIEVLRNSKMKADQSIYDALVDSESSDAAEALAMLVGDFFKNEKAVEALKQMGSVAEPAVLLVAKNGDEKQSLAAIEILGEIGSEKGLVMLKRLQKRGKPEVRGAAQVAAMRLQSRLNSSGSPEIEEEINDDDPFAETSSTDVAIGIGSHPANGDWSQVDQPMPSEPEGSFRPDPLPSEVTVPRRYKSTRLSEYPGGMSGRNAGVMVARNKPERLGTLTTDPFKKTPAMIQLVDIVRGKALKPVPISTDTVRADLSPDGRKIVALAEEDKRSRIDIYELGSKETTLVDSWHPHADSDHMWATDMMWVRWISLNQFATLNRTGDLVVWDVEGAMARFQFAVEGWATPALSPGGNQLAANTDDGLLVFDLTNGETLAWFKGVSNRGDLGFDSSGTRLALVSGTRVRVWDIASVYLSTDFTVKDLSSAADDFRASVTFDGDQLIVRGSQAVDVIDLKTRRVNTRYTHSDRSGAGYGNQTISRVDNHRLSGLYATKTIATESSDVDDPDSLLAIKPGAEVSFDVRVGNGLDKEVRDFLTKAAEEAGLVVVPSSPFKFTARLETKNQKVNYRSFGAIPFRNKGEEVNVNEKHYTVELFIDGDSSWSFRRKQGAQMHLRSKRGESTQQAANRVTEASANYFKGIEFPRYLVHPEHAGPLATKPLRGK